MSKVAIYCRLSVEDEDKKGEVDSESINNQKLLLIEYALKHELDIYHIYVDDNYSGLDENRPAFKKMLEDAKNHRFDIILCKNQSRFTRDMMLVEKYIHGLLPELGIRFIGVIDNADSCDKYNKRARQINGLVNEWYCEELSDNIRLILDKKREDGEFIGSFAPYGYKKSRQDKHHLKIDDEAAKNIRKIYDLYLEGYSINEICKYLTIRKIPTPNHYRKIKEQLEGKTLDINNQAGSSGQKNEVTLEEKSFVKWAPSTIKKILHSKVYIGHMIQGKERKISYKSNKRIVTNADEWFVILDTHDPIIPRELYIKVQERLKERERTRQNRRIPKEDVLIGKVICGHCNKAMYKTSGNKSNTKYYHCSTYYKSRGDSCIKNSIRYDSLMLHVESEIIKTFQEVYEKNNSQSRKLKACVQTVFKQGETTLDDSDNSKTILNHNDTYSDVDKLQEEIELCKKSILNIYIDKTKGILKDEVYIDLVRSLNHKLEVLKSEIDILNMKKQELQCREIKIQEPNNRNNKELDFFQEIMLDNQKKKFLISELIDTIEIMEMNKDTTCINIHWKI
jgi:DNA invertase Pin-like site-specific DNA recombinase